MPDAVSLPSWNERSAKQAIHDFVARVTTPGGPGYVPESERIAVFDNDGTLWCEKPLPVELAFILERLAAMAQEDPTLRPHQPWKAAYEKDHAWLGGLVSRQYQGDDSDVKAVLGGVLKAFTGVMVEDYEAAATAFLHRARHPTLGCAVRACRYRPMVELLRFLEAHGFTTFIVAGGDRDFMRSITREIYGIPPERVVGGAGVRRPLLAAGNSNGDIEMLRFAGGGRPALRLLVLHDDSEREFHYVAGAERSLELAKAQGWTVVSIKNDWKTVFSTDPGEG